jgi:hypothetical protein
MSGYYLKLRDPRWQKKRLEVFELAAFKCELCNDTEKTVVGYFENLHLFS